MLALFAPHRLALSIVLAIIVGSSVLGLAQPLLLMAVIDDALPHSDIHLLLLAVGGMLAVTIGTLVAFTAVQSGIFRPVMGLLNVGVQWVSSMTLFNRIFGYLDLVTDVPAPAEPVAVDVARVTGEVGLDHVTFAYAAGSPPAVADVSLVVPAGTSLALVGDTGSGKSTLGSLISRCATRSRGSSPSTASR